MALDKASLKTRITTELQGKGFKTEGEHARVQDMAEAIANAIVDEMQASAKAIVGGNQYPIQ